MILTATRVELIRIGHILKIMQMGRSCVSCKMMRFRILKRWLRKNESSLDPTKESHKISLRVTSSPTQL